MFVIKQRDKQQQFQNTELTSNERMAAIKRLKDVQRITLQQTNMFAIEFTKEIDNSNTIPLGTMEELAEKAMNGDVKVGLFGNGLKLQYDAREFLINQRTLKKANELYGKIAFCEPLNEQDLTDLNRLTGKMRIKINWFRLFSL